MIKTLTMKSYNEEKSIINYTLGIKTIDTDASIQQIDNENIVESIVKYSLKNCQEFIQPKWLALYETATVDDFNFLKIHHYPVGGYDANLYLFYSIFYNHAILSAYYTATHLCSETQSLYNAFKRNYGDIDQSDRYKKYKSFNDKNASSYLNYLLKKIPFKSDSSNNIFSAYSDFAINLINSYSHFSINKINDFIKTSNRSKMSNVNSSLTLFAKSYFFNSGCLLDADDSESIMSIYEFERYFNIDYIQFAAKSYVKILQEDFNFKQKGELFNRLYTLGSLLPNVYSRKCIISNLLSVLNINNFNTSDESPEIVASIIKSKSNETISAEWLERAKKFLTHLVYIAFPLIEKAVFINLYEYFKSQNKEDNTIDLMKNCLKSYINENAKLLSYDFSLKDVKDKTQRLEKEELVFESFKSLPQKYKMPDELLDINPIIHNLKTGIEKMKKTEFEGRLPLAKLPEIFEDVFASNVFDNISTAEKSEVILLYRHLIKHIYNSDNLNQYNRQFSLDYFSYDSISHSFQRLIVDTFMNKSIT